MPEIVWWVGDVLLIVVVLPIVVALLARIIAALWAAHRAIRSIENSAKTITSSLPGAVRELSAMTDSSAALPDRAAMAGT